ncbi:type III pantothenate kinase [Mesonia sp. K7]|uniref:type III pantothenate kinase n=1 Tax=Mesonia sp. K7 TaxID=2218606 RepID=UPI000DA82B30|nr:type III pantothenate kinase [Mesonia sp. K7]PZD77780.1 type III pantothenate kinase [Mesonia sp. K7]
MANLIIDIGNTQIKLAIYQNHQILNKQIVQKSDFIKSLENIFSEYKITQSILSSVTNVTDEAISFLEKNTSLLLLSATTPVSFRNLYKTPITLGIDRIALTAAAVEKYPQQNCLIIDAGTCITYDLINKNNEYLGGIISPGLLMRAKAMHHFTDKLPLVDFHESETFSENIGKTTQENIWLGVVKTTTIEIDGLIDEYRQDFSDLTVILTGGDGEFLSNRLKNSIFAADNFLLDGLNYILEFNTNK